MPAWAPNKEWQGEDAYVIGGGPSLKSFDWELLRGKNTIGCNSAFLLGGEIIQITIFGDVMWWEKIGQVETENYSGLVVGSNDKLHRYKDCEWLLTMERETKKTGLGYTKLGWNGNTGSLALNLALILGASRVFLLGFDMKLGTQGEANWHDLRYEKAQEQVYKRFQRGFAHVARDVETMFPGVEVWNVSDDSNLNVFPKVSIHDHFRKEVPYGVPADVGC